MEDLTAHETLVASLVRQHEAAGEDVTVIETHISSVLLAGDLALKLKKPVDLGFLDFTRREERERCCAEEVRLNSRLAPSVYVDTVEITGSHEAPAVGGDGPVIDHAVRMRRFPQDALLSRLAGAHAIEPRWISALARRVAAFHDGVDRAPAASDFGSPERIAEPMRLNFEHLDPLVAHPARRAQLAELAAWTDAELGRQAPVLAARRAGGFVRECHGDMHLGNMVLIDGAVEVFDGIEFNDDFRWIDIQSDVAFLTMDLDHRDEPALGWRFLNDWLAETGDYPGLAVHRLYQVYRAMVRAKIDAIRAHQPHVAAAERDAALDDCGVLLDLAEGYTHSRTPELLLTCGLSGTGKSTVARRRAIVEGRIQVRSDVERKRLFGLRPEDDSGSPLGGGIYRPGATQRTYERLLEVAGALLDAGFDAIVDATFLTRASRRPFLELAARRGSPARILYCEAPEETLRQRIVARTGDVSEADLAVLDGQLRRFEPPGTDEPVERVAT